MGIIGPPTLDGLRGAVLGRPLTVRMDMSANSARGMAETSVVTDMAAAAQVHRLYQLADYDAAAQLLPGSSCAFKVNSVRAIVTTDAESAH